jgi:hypothetical protein
MEKSTLVYAAAVVLLVVSGSNTGVTLILRAAQEMVGNEVQNSAPLLCTWSPTVLLNVAKHRYENIHLLAINSDIPYVPVYSDVVDVITIQLFIT